MAPPDPAVITRLVKLLGLLGSDHEGERATAGRLAHDLLRSQKLSWDDVVGVAREGGNVRTWHEPNNFREGAIEALAWPEALTEWEVGFLKSISSRWHLSPRQRQTLTPIIDKVRAYARASGATFT